MSAREGFLFVLNFAQSFDKTVMTISLDIATEIVRAF